MNFKSVFLELPKIGLLLLLAVILYGVGDWAYISTLNYYGYCTSEGVNYKSKFSTKERLDIAIEHYLQYQDSLDYKEIRKVEGASSLSSESLIERFKLIPYGTREEFRNTNPGCCERVWGLPEGDWFGFWERTDGAGDGMFDFKHKIRYIDQGGNYKEFSSRKSFYTVNNCGNAKFRFYH